MKIASLVSRNALGCTVFGSAVLCLGHSASVRAQTDTDALQEIVVTATKRADPLSKVPISIAAYTRDTMDAQGVRNIQDIVAQTPGVDIEKSGGNGAGVRIAIRGIDSNAGAATTGVYIDDTAVQARNNPINFDGTSFPEVFDIERVEVLRGPQGTLFGAGAEGGVVRFVTVQPSLTEYSGYGRAEASATETGSPSGELGAAFGGPIVDNVLGFRVSAWERHDGGYVDRTAWETHQTFKDTNWTDSKVARAAMTYAPNEALTITPSVQYQEIYSHDSGNYWNTLSNPDQTRFNSGYQLRQPTDDSTTLASLKVEGNTSGITLTSISSFFHRNNNGQFDVTNTDTASVLGPQYTYPVSPDGGLYTVTSLTHTTQDVITEEFRVQNSSDDAAVKWVAGAFFSQAKLINSLRQPAPEFPALLQQVTGIPFNQFFGGPLLDGIYEFTGIETSTDTQTAVFGNVDYRFADQWTLTAGLRGALTQMRYSDAEDGPEGPVADVYTVTSGTQKDHPVTPKIGLTWQPDDRNMVYASIAKGYRIGGVNDSIPLYCGAAAMAEAKPTYQSDTTISYEVGAKSRPDGGKVQIDGSIYHIDWKNIQQYLIFPCLYGYNGNSGTARSDGFDLSVNAQLSRHLLAGGSVGFTKAEYTTTTISPTGATVTADGQTLGQTPWTLFGFAEYSVPILSDKRGYARLQEKYNSRNHYLFGQQNPSNFNYDPNWRPNAAINQLDFRAGITLQRADVSVFVDNVCNQTPQLYMSHLIGSPLYMNSTLRPRTVGVTATFRY